MGWGEAHSNNRKYLSFHPNISKVSINDSDKLAVCKNADFGDGTPISPDQMNIVAVFEEIVGGNA
jgi:hypothetical protein